MMPLVYLCDFCGLPILGTHYAFSVQRRMYADTSSLPPASIGEAPLLDINKQRNYVLHGEHFDEDPASVAVALYSNFNERPLPESGGETPEEPPVDPDPTPEEPTPDPTPEEPTPEPTPEPVPEPAPEPPPDPAPDPEQPQLSVSMPEPPQAVRADPRDHLL